ncbi:MAG: T9SS type A sorting domain-containing protein [Bacteroidia bacterium]
MKTKITLILIALAYFAFDTSAQINLLHQFGGNPDGKNPKCSLVSDGTFFYGTTNIGGINDLGAVFKVMPDGSNYSKLVDFDGALKGSLPYGSIYTDGTFLYGMTSEGGTNNMGTLYKIKNDGTGFLKLLDFGGAPVSGQYHGQNPTGSLIFDGTYLYGMVNNGDYLGFGNIFKIKPDGTSYTVIHTFDGTHGSHPSGSLIFDGTFLYGITEKGGSSSNALGTVFKIMPDGSSFSVLNEFTGTNGSNPLGSLLLESGIMYGYTYDGGTNNTGVIFKIMPDGTGFSKLLDFSLTESNPSYGALVSDGTFLYGMTKRGGTNNLGIVFKIKPNGTGFLDMFNFDVTNGAWPASSLIYDGTNLYGTTNSAGINSSGVIFRFDMLTGISEIKDEKMIIIYPNPSNGVIQIKSDVSVISEIEISNLVGEKIYTSTINSNKAEIDLSKQATGVYFIQITSIDKTIAIKKIILQ